MALTVREALVSLLVPFKSRVVRVMRLKMIRRSRVRRMVRRRLRRSKV